ncbi:MAG: hypothetical protein HN352_02660 [Bacteroidetes bacterium]|nr:hypothetical protein [Bacteroidota bacterium]MBT4410321.1 hypothetical protein [Bacteroidota bacterium]MBT7464837.1 hypothetical protein [Bacteroidota bacterium]
MNYWCKNIRYLAVVLILFSGLQSQGQEKENEKRIVNFSSDLMDYDESLGPQVHRLTGNVWMEHEDIILSCDSAHLNQGTNRFKGFGNVHIIKADSINLYGDFLDYDGSSRMALLEGRVRMEHNNTLLKTNHLHYNMEEEISWYFEGGQIIDSINTLESTWGYYFMETEEYHFKNQVFLSNEDNTLSTDTLFYNGKTELVKFLGPTQIFGDTNYIYCENGWYDSPNNLSSFNKNAVFQSRDQILQGDSLLYDRENNITEAFGNVTARDSIQNSIIKGEKLYFDEAADHIVVTENTLYIMIDGLDSLFLHADTLLSYSIDSVDSRKIEAFHQVQFFRSDMQGRCDSLDYLVVDSIIHLYNEPILWQEKNQLTATEISIKMSDEGIDFIEMLDMGFLITEIDSILYNQIKGKTIRGYFKDNDLNRVEVIGNGESLFYPEEDSSHIGLNNAVSSEIIMVFQDGKITGVKFLYDPNSKLTPLKQITSEERKLEGFIWHGLLRPKNRKDVFEWK